MGTKTARGSLSTFALGFETSYGQPPAANTFKELSFTSEAIGETTNPVVSTEITPDRTVPNARGGNRMSAGTVTMDFGINRHAKWLQYLLAATVVQTTITPTALAGSVAYMRGDYVTSNAHLYVCKVAGTEAGSPALTNTDGDAELAGGTVWSYVGPAATPVYKYVLTGSRDMPGADGGVTLEKGVEGGDEDLFTMFCGGKFNTGTFTIPQDNLVTVAWDLMFQRSLPSATARYSTPTVVVDNSIMGYETMLSINGVDNIDIKEGTLTMTNSIANNDFRLGSRDPKSVNEQRRENKGTFTAYFTDGSLYRMFENEDTVNFLASMVNSGNYIGINFPEAKFFGDPLTKTSGAGALTAAFDVTAFKYQAAFDVQVIIKSTTNNLFA